ncbi:MAG: type II toxin-antitoxin system VapB family antitoxin [Selenomonas sp.]|nr:type II toxin-antitoxin system VapB family antitoxin [Selenomonas sp.]
MATNLALDDKLLNQAVSIGGLKTKKDTVTLALTEFIQRRKAEDLIDAFGTCEVDESYDYKAERKRHV